MPSRTGTPPSSAISRSTARSRALATQSTDPNAARKLWGQIDREVVDRAPLVPLIAWNVIDVLSKRVGNYQYSGRGEGVLIDQLWVR